MEFIKATNDWDILCQECGSEIKKDEEYNTLIIARSIITLCDECYDKLKDILGGK